MSSPFDRTRSERLAKAIREKRRREARALQSNPKGGLYEFVKYFWHVLEPVDEFVDGWPVEAMCAHLEAISRGEMIVIGTNVKKMNRLLANVPPGFMKSMLVNVFWPAWEWGPLERPHLRYLSFSYSPDLTQRDNAKFRDLITSPEYRELWGQVFNVVGDGKIRVTNDKTGFKFATSIGGVGTGERGHRVTLDDPNKIKVTEESDEARAAISNWVLEGMQNRLNDLERDAIVIIMQRVHEADSSGAVLKELSRDYCHLAIPMEYEYGRHFSHYTGWNGGRDPRNREGELAWPTRYPAAVLVSFKKNAYLWSGQYQQTPTPRGGGLFKEHWWQVQEVRRPPNGGAMVFVPEVKPIFVLASLDTAFSEKEENDYSALTIWVVCDDPVTKQRKLLLADAWQKRLPELSGERVERRSDESEAAWRKRAQPKWGLVEWVAYSCQRRRANLLIVENKNRAPDVIRTLRKHFQDRDFGIQAIDIRGDKWGRANAITDLFTDDMIYAPAEVVDGDVRWLDWADEAIREVSVFPRGAHDDIVDSMTMALKFLRDRGYAIRKDEAASSLREALTHKSHAPKPSIYDV